MPDHRWCDGDLDRHGAVVDEDDLGFGYGLLVLIPAGSAALFGLGVWGLAGGDPDSFWLPLALFGLTVNLIATYCGLGVLIGPWGIGAGMVLALTISTLTLDAVLNGWRQWSWVLVALMAPGLTRLVFVSIPHAVRWVVGPRHPERFSWYDTPTGGGTSTDRDDGGEA